MAAAAAAVIITKFLRFGRKLQPENLRSTCVFVRRCDTTDLRFWSSPAPVRAVTTITILRQAYSSCTPPLWQRLYYYYYYYYCCGTTRSRVSYSRCRRSPDRVALRGTRVRECVCVCAHARARGPRVCACVPVRRMILYYFIMFSRILALHEAARCSGPGVCRV